MTLTTDVFPLLALPFDKMVEIVQELDSLSIWSFRSANVQCKSIADSAITFLWNSLRQNAPAGPVDIEQEMTRISTDNPDDTIVELVRKLASKFIQMGATPTKHLPLTVADFESLQVEVQDKALHHLAKNKKTDSNGSSTSNSSPGSDMA